MSSLRKQMEIRGRLRFESELAPRRDEVKMRVKTSQDNEKRVV